MTRIPVLTAKAAIAAIAVVALVFAGACTSAPAHHSPSLVNVSPAATHDGLTGLPYSLDVRSSTLGSELTMPADTIFNGFGCTGGNLSPALEWTAGPAGTKSYLVMLHDPDAPTGVGFHHWWIADLPASTTSLPKGFGTDTQGDAGVTGRNDYGATGYGGPCPPEGRTHRYEFYVWALGVDALGVDAQTSAAVVRFLVRTQALAVGRLVATYGR